MKDVGLPIALLLLGVAWLLDSLDWLPNIRWVWVIGLLAAGIGILVLDGVTKSSLVSSALLVGAGVMAFFHQFHGLGWRFIIPIMLIVAGVAQLIARSPAIPASRDARRHFKKRTNRPDQPDLRD